MTLRQKSALKGWIVDVFGEVDSRPVWQVIVAKLVHRVWRGFRSA
jgi:hypothetical protein